MTEPFVDIETEVREILSSVDEPQKLEYTDNSIKKAKKHNEEAEKEYNKRQGLYSQLLQSYIDNVVKKLDKNLFFKQVFFWMITGSFFAIVAVSLGLLISSVFCIKDSVTAIVTVVGSLSSMLATMIVLPRIIAEHLFPQNEDSAIIELVKQMQANDKEINGYIISQPIEPPEE